MKKIIVLSAINLVLAATVFAQAPTAAAPPPPAHEAPQGKGVHGQNPHEKEMQSPEHRAKKHVERMAHELGLNDEQRSKVFASELNFFTQRDALQQKKSRERRQRGTERAHRLHPRLHREAEIAEGLIEAHSVIDA